MWWLVCYPVKYLHPILPIIIFIIITTTVIINKAGIAQWYSAVFGLGDSGFESWQGLAIFLFTTASRPALGPTQPPIQWVSGILSLGVKRPGREADHSPPSSAEVKNAWSYVSTLPIRLRGVVLSYSTGTLPFTIIVIVIIVVVNFERFGSFVKMTVVINK
jgi:hypothetical protein